MHRSDQFTWEDAVHAASYAHRIGFRQERAKEVRIFGLVGWLSDRYGRHTARIIGELAIARKVGQRRWPCFSPWSLWLCADSARPHRGGLDVQPIIRLLN